jgi:xanthine dehydrogenase molybdopterin-binding subunit B
MGVTPYGMEVTDFILGALTARLAESSDYERRRAAIAAWNAQNPMLKRGIALTPVKFGISFTLTHLNQAGALVHVYQDGSIQLNHGGTEMGQGLFQKVAQVAAARLGVGMERVRITATDTGKVPNTSATAASSGSDLNGMAVQAACDAIRDRIAAVVAPQLQADPRDLVFEGGDGAGGCRRNGLGGGSSKDLSCPRQPVGDRVLCHPWHRLGPDRGQGTAVFLLCLWRGVQRGGDRHIDGREPHPARRYLA